MRVLSYIIIWRAPTLFLFPSLPHAFFIRAWPSNPWRIWAPGDPGLLFGMDLACQVGRVQWSIATRVTCDGPAPQKNRWLVDVSSPKYGSKNLESRFWPHHWHVKNHQPATDESSAGHRILSPRTPFLVTAMVELAAHRCLSALGITRPCRPWHEHDVKIWWLGVYHS